ncbi:hypothetical protein WA026_008397, partial [Henosepilachna vigintioctopunctata]
KFAEHDGISPMLQSCFSVELNVSSMISNKSSFALPHYRRETTKPQCTKQSRKRRRRKLMQLQGFGRIPATIMGITRSKFWKRIV